jgi:hypothetical protein
MYRLFSALLYRESLLGQQEDSEVANLLDECQFKVVFALESFVLETFRDSPLRTSAVSLDEFRETKATSQSLTVTKATVDAVKTRGVVMVDDTVTPPVFTASLAHEVKRFGNMDVRRLLVSARSVAPDDYVDWTVNKIGDTVTPCSQIGRSFVLYAPGTGIGRSCLPVDSEASCVYLRAFGIDVEEACKDAGYVWESSLSSIISKAKRKRYRAGCIAL